MKILSVAAEVAGIYKTGGLGDVVRDLACELQKNDVEIRTVLPMYKWLVDDKDNNLLWEGEVAYGGQVRKVKLFSRTIPMTNLECLMVYEPEIVSSDNPNDAVRFALFSKVLIDLLKLNVIQADVLHLHDWHLGLVPLIVKYSNLQVKTVLTIHNILFQGSTNATLIDEIGVDRAFAHSIMHDIQDGDLNFLLQGIVHADFVTTVSPTYKEEILAKKQDGGLSVYLHDKGARFQGVLNAIDMNVWNPENDLNLDLKFNLSNWKEGKLSAKKQLESKLKFSGKDEIWLAYIGRADGRQKGIGLVLDAVAQGLLDDGGFRLIMLSQGDKYLEEQIRVCASGKEKFDAFVEFNDPLAHIIYAACDIALIPSAYEPCGLVQMMSMRYGCVPIARATGGLKDTIIDGRDGFLFEEYSGLALSEKIRQARELFKNEARWQPVVSAGMSKDWSWKNSAVEYKKVFESLTFS